MLLVEKSAESSVQLKTQKSVVEAPEDSLKQLRANKQLIVVNQNYQDDKIGILEEDEEDNSSHHHHRNHRRKKAIVDPQ